MDESYLNRDCLFEISEMIESGSTWKNFILVCTTTNSFNTKEKVRRYANHLATLLKLFPDKPWDWFWLSHNASLSFDFVLAHPDLPQRAWKWVGLSDNPSLSF